MISTILHILFIIVFAYCAFSILYLFTLSFAGRFLYKEKNKIYSGTASPNRIAILVPAYREDGIILSTAENLLKLDYPRELYDIYIIADSFAPETIQALRKQPLQVLEVSFEKSTKTRSLNEAFSRISRPYDIALICDADNMLAKDFLAKLDNAFRNGAKAVQGRRVAKNLDSSFAILDACSEAINNHIFRKGPDALGLSSSVIGSGMGFQFDMIRKILGEISAVGGFDKVLQLKVVEQGHRIEYHESALVFDEKVNSSKDFQQQRKRWVSSQFIYLKQFFFPAFKKLFKGNISYFNLAVVNNLIVPRAFLFIMLPLLVVAGFLIHLPWGIAASGLCVAYMLSLVMALPGSLVNKDLFYAILRLPRAVFIMLGTLLHLKKANKTFIHTVHTKTEVSNTLFKDQS